jgi:hypothetical protein
MQLSVPPWLTEENNQVETLILLTLIASVQEERRSVIK